MGTDRDGKFTPLFENRSREITENPYLFGSCQEGSVKPPCLDRSPSSGVQLFMFVLKVALVVLETLSGPQAKPC